MDKETWKQHLEDAEGLTRPSNGGDPIAWQAAGIRHQVVGCAECRQRRTTARRSAGQRHNNEAMRSLGLTRVVGSVSGKVYWE